MFWKIYAGVITVVAAGMYAHIRHVEGWVAGMGALLAAQETDDELDDINLDEDED